MALVEVTDLHKAFSGHPVLNGVNLTVEAGAVVAIIGRSGSGKSTLLRCLNGLDQFDNGAVKIGSHHIGPYVSNETALRRLRLDVGMVFQSYNLFPHLTVERNITLAPMLVRGQQRREAEAAAAAALERVGLAAKRDAFPHQLSGGQQQRIAIARSLAMSPVLMLFDEVTSALDPEWTREVLKVMEDLAHSGMTMILVTHEMGFAHDVATDVVFMNNGVIWERGPPTRIFGAPETAELRSFLAI
jgi:polar amino acid transport system ATP-binding protein